MVPISQLVVHVSNNFWVQLVGSDCYKVHREGKERGRRSWKVRTKEKGCRRRENEAGQSKMGKRFVFTPLFIRM